MSKKKMSSNSPGGLVYSTNPDFKLKEIENEVNDTLLPAIQKLKIIQLLQ